MRSSQIREITVDSGELSTVCPKCYNVQPFGRVLGTLNFQVNNRADNTTLDICTPRLVNHPIDYYDLLGAVPFIQCCPKCHVSCIAVDESIADAVAFCNKKGYYTIESCEGHSIKVDTNNCDTPIYIRFANDLPQEVFNVLRSNLEWAGLYGREWLR